MGILDGKSRIFDTVLTAEGRRQLAEGTLRLKYASFTDGGTFYEGDVASGSSDTTHRILFEAPGSLPRDQVTFESDDSGNLIPFLGRGESLSSAGRVILSSGSLARSSNFTSLAGQLIVSSVENFKDLRIVGTTDPFLEEAGFQVSQTSVTFTVTNDSPVPEPESNIPVSISSLPNFAEDPHLSHIPNFMYLPPVNAGTGKPLAEYKRVSRKSIDRYEDLATVLSGRDRVELTFPVTSKDNNLYTQVFQVSDGEMVKLDVVDFGDFPTSDPDHPTKHVFFAGRIFLDGGTGVFCNQFVIVFD